MSDLGLASTNLAIFSSVEMSFAHIVGGWQQIAGLK